MDNDGLPKDLNLSDYYRFTFIKITYSGWIEDKEYIEKSIIVVMN